MMDDRKQELAQGLAHRRLHLVLAESCTGGRAAALLTEVPGISQWFCGSSVTYRESVKHQWLQVAEELMHQHTAESQQTSDSMALGALSNTNEADLACAITGHLGPGVEIAVDGLVFLSIATRSSPMDNCDSAAAKVSTSPAVIIYRNTRRLDSTSRTQRQLEAARWMLGEILDLLPRICVRS